MKLNHIILLFVLALVSCQSKNNQDSKATSDYSGSESCIECHERFYKLWAPSFHGKAMQPVNAGFIAEYNLPVSEPIELEGKSYQVDYKDSTMLLYEKEGDQLLNTYTITWSLGGRNVFCFLTPMEKGRLQTIPLAYDMNRKAWFNYPESAVRTFVEDVEDEALPWKDRMYTFNTGCYNCHVSQLSSNFDLASDSYHTTWRESGINCETCHGPSAEHVRVCREAKEGEIPEDLKIIVTSTFTPEQHNSSCATCHAKGNPIKSGYMPGDDFFNYFSLAALEDPDFSPDGRDFGENYTYTGWLLNECMTNSDLHCVTCHTSSGRNRFKDNPNDACISCHVDKGEDILTHTMHESGTPGSICVNCHVPSREFVGHFIRSDHSFRPPMPEATIKFGSPNACNSCHQDKTPEWANQIVKARPNGNYQEETLEWAQLVKEARDEDWTNLGKMLEIIQDTNKNEVVVTSLIRLLANCTLPEKWDGIKVALNNPSPLVRSAAATGLNGNTTEEVKSLLIVACSDRIRLVRTSAASTLSTFPADQIPIKDNEVVANATEEYKKSLVTRPDDWSAHYNMGIYHQNRGELNKALESYETSSKLYPPATMPLINSSVLYSYIGNPAKAEENLRKAIQYNPNDEAANLNLGLLLAEQGRAEEAKKALEKALEANPNQGVAAYNLSVLTAQSDLNQAIKYAQIAATVFPDDPKYAYTLAFYQNQAKQTDSAIKTLKAILKNAPNHLNSVFLLGQVYVGSGQKEKAKELYMQTLKLEKLSDAEKASVQQALVELNK